MSTPDTILLYLGGQYFQNKTGIDKFHFSSSQPNFLMMELPPNKLKADLLTITLKPHLWEELYTFEFKARRKVWGLFGDITCFHTIEIIKDIPLEDIQDIFAFEMGFTL